MGASVDQAFIPSPHPPLVINRLLHPKLAYDSTQFVPMTVIGAIPNVLLVHPKVSAETVAELIAFAKANPGKLNYSSQGQRHRLAPHRRAVQVDGWRPADHSHSPQRHRAALADLLGGQVDMMCDNLGASLPHVRSGKLKALALACAKRVAALPNTPALARRCRASRRWPGSAS
jgi:tripartite-type tricarboxylate transporter receptor subunit TctC